MFEFDESFKFARRSPSALAPRAMVATSHPLAVQAGIQMLRLGGNAVDAAIAAASVLTVVEPMATGLGGDAFALIYSARDRRVSALNASGRSPRGMSLETLGRRGLAGIPEESGLSVTVPGMVDGWAECHRRFGKLAWDQILSPAIEYAEKGFLVTAIIGAQWEKLEGKLSRNRESARLFLSQGKAPVIGRRFINPDLGRTLRVLAERGPQEFYQGTLAVQIAETVRNADGVMDPEDLRAHRSDWVTPLSTLYRGYQVLELPPNTQGLAVLLALNLMEGEPLCSAGHNSCDYLHFLIESVKLAFADVGRHVADPERHPVPVQGLLAPLHTNRRRSLISSRAQEMPPGVMTDGTDTVYIAVVDEEGNAVSLINSLYRFFGSGITVPGTGVVLQNRGIGFSCQPDHPNCLAPGKRCFHTLVPSMICRDGTPWAVLGVVGAMMQPQAQVQIIANLIDFKMDPQAALDARRFRFLQGLEVALEKGIPARVRAGLASRGHRLYPGQFPDGFGGGQVILVGEEGLCGGSDFRKDGRAAGF